MIIVDNVKTLDIPERMLKMNMFNAESWEMNT